MSTNQMSSTPVPSVPGAAPPRDVRTFWRVLLAVLAPLPMVGLGAYYLLSPIDGGASLESTVGAYAADPVRAELLPYLQVPFLFIVPAVFAVVWVSRRRAPRLTTVGALIALTGSLVGFGTVGGIVTPATLAARYQLDVTALSELERAMMESPVALVGSLLFILGVTVGLLLLGLAMWRSHAAPAWMGIALAVGGFTHPFMPGHVAAGIGLLVAAVGFVGASRALLRWGNDDFDLPPLGKAA